MLRAIRAVASGEAIFSPAIARRLMALLRRARSPHRPRHLPGADRARARGPDLDRQGTATRRSPSDSSSALKTVRNHVSNIFTKLQVADRAQATLRAREAGLA